MPLYDYKCNWCGFEEEQFVHDLNDTVRCTVCRRKMSRQFPTSARIGVFPSNGIFLEHVSPEGKHFSSKKELKDFARDNDLELGALL